MSTISVYTTTYNAIDQEYCVVEGIKSALGFADEVIVLDSHSTDGTIDAINAIGDDRVKIYYIDWLPNIGWAMYKIAKSMAIGRCTKDWCVLMDADEVFHENEYVKIKQVPDILSPEIVGVKFNTLHFYGDHKHILNGCKGWKDLYTNKVYMVRNGLGIHHGNSGMDIDAHVNRYGIPLPQENLVHLNLNVFHYGHLRSDKAYLKKQNRMHTFYEGKTVEHKEVPHIDLNNLGTFSGEHPINIRDRIEKKRVL